MNLCLGTVQFGLDYGICNQKRPTVDESIKMLDYAYENDIRTFDTASAYGNAEEILGKFIHRKKLRDTYTIISKLMPNCLENIKVKDYEKVITKNIETSLLKLNTDYLDAYLLHTSKYIFNDEIIYALDKIKSKGYTREIGVSVYEPREALKAFKRKEISFIQLPYSIFDQRMEKENIFGLDDDAKMTIHSRSAFVQGLITINEEGIPEYLSEARPLVRKLNKLAKENNISKVELALQFVKKQESISHLVFGVDSIEQLKENIQLFHNNMDGALLEEIAKAFEGIKSEVVMPSLWKK